MTAHQHRPELIVRPMTAADLPQVMEIAARLSHAPNWTAQAYRAALDPQAAVRRIALVAGENPAPAGAAQPEAAPGPVYGFAIASLAAPEAELETIAVTEAGQRRGIARRLMERLTGDLRDAGARELWLEVRASNQAAIGLYRSAGFGQIGRRRGYYADPVEDALVLRLPLG